jgi:hypothetical protein
MDSHPDYLALDEESLLAACDVHIYKSSGPGGQHRNKVSSAVRLRHRPTGITAHGDDSRSQHDNKRLAVRRLQMNLACQLRRRVDLSTASLPAYVEECMFVARGGDAQGRKRIEVGTKDHRFWHVTGWVLDLLDTLEGQLSTAADYLGVSTGNLSSLLGSDRHLLAAANMIRKQHDQKPLK